MNDKPNKPEQPQDPLPPKVILKDFLRSFLMPTLVTKAFVLYFGIMYSDHPGEGYGYGLIISVSFTVIALSLFAWKYRNYEDL
ncbi:hypothetical protein CIK05_05780 [Bdellovibrio sp. qaytius]|nr:hypothetical protein CIK05_05780 [Bdellovibrio sp. qaytius]